MSSNQTFARRPRLGELLVQSGLIDQERLERALQEQRRWGEPLGRTLVQMGLVDEDRLIELLARQLRLPHCDPATLELPDGIAGRIGLHLVEQYGVMPISADDGERVLWVATSDPTNLGMRRALEQASGYGVRMVLASAERIEKTIRRYYYGEAQEPRPMPEVPTPAAAPPLPGQQAVEVPPSRDPLTEIVAAVENLEELSAAHVRALRAVVELLVEKGILDREEYLERVRGGAAPTGS